MIILKVQEEKQTKKVIEPEQEESDFNVLKEMKEKNLFQQSK